MNNMPGPRRVDTTWPQTVVLQREPVRVRDRRRSGSDPVDWALLALFVATIVLIRCVS